MKLQSRRAQRRALTAAALCAAAVAVLPVPAQASGGNLSLPKVETRNIYLGADLTPAVAAVGCTPQPFCTLAANQIVWNQVVATNFPARAKLLAREIDDDDPWVIGLQEVALWRSGPVNGVKDAATVQYDFLEILKSEIAARGLKYKVQVVQQEADVESPAGSPPTFADATDRRLTMRDVILVRSDLPKILISFSNPTSGNYAPTRTAEIGIGASTYGDPCAYTPPPQGPNCIVFKRGWTATDVNILKKPVAVFVNTHLESAASGIRQLQAAELVGAFGSGPLLNPNKAAILVGDLNSDPSIPYGGDPTSSVSDGAAYGIIAGAGFVDSGNTENTFGHNSSVNDFPSNPMTERIDHILTRPGTYGLLSTKVVGDGSAPVYRTPGGLWPSDHAGVIAGIG
jgi:hypothetical protein